MRPSRAWAQATTPAERLDALAHTAAATQQTIEENADLVRLMLHEPAAARDLVDELWVRNMADAYTIMGQAMRATAEEAGTEIDDPEAISAVLLAALSYVPIMQVMIGRTPGEMDPDRFRDACLRLSRGVFTHGVPN
ncbi:hypothetical protein [Mycobacterium sp.]|uniref:hypothetical protein n=1 Tax=Mycobacterium sp. TaxID=1785 RepID=UPI003F9AC3A4